MPKYMFQQILRLLLHFIISLAVFTVLLFFSHDELLATKTYISCMHAYPAYRLLSLKQGLDVC